jgi:hypothetical protein
MNFQLTDASDPRQATVLKDVKRLERTMGAKPGKHGEVTVKTLLILIQYYSDRISKSSLSSGSVKSYLSALKSIHTGNGFDWKIIRDDFRVLAAMKRIDSSPENIQRRRKQDYAVTLVDLERFCATLDPSKHSDLVAGALATTLFWALGRLHELLHAKKFKRMRIDSIEEAINRSTLRRSFRIFLERPKMRRAGEMQFLALLRHLGISNPQHWMTLLLYSISEQSFEVTSPWQLDSHIHADSKWLLGKFGQVLEPMSQRLGPSSFRAGGYTHMAYMGYELSLLRLFGRWCSDANDTYLRECPQVLAAVLSSKSNSMPPVEMVLPLAGSVWGRPSALGLGPQKINKRPLGARSPAPTIDQAFPYKRRSCAPGNDKSSTSTSKEFVAPVFGFVAPVFGSVAPGNILEKRGARGIKSESEKVKATLSRFSNTLTPGTTLSRFSNTLTPESMPVYKNPDIFSPANAGGMPSQEMRELLTLFGLAHPENAHRRLLVPLLRDGLREEEIALIQGEGIDTDVFIVPSFYPSGADAIDDTPVEPGVVAPVEAAISVHSSGPSIRRGGIVGGLQAALDAADSNSGSRSFAHFMDHSEEDRLEIFSSLPAKKKSQMADIVSAYGRRKGVRVVLKDCLKEALELQPFELCSLQGPMSVIVGNWKEDPLTYMALMDQYCLLVSLVYPLIAVTRFDWKVAAIFEVRIRAELHYRMFERRFDMHCGELVPLNLEMIGALTSFVANGRGGGAKRDKKEKADRKEWLPFQDGVCRNWNYGQDCLSICKDRSWRHECMVEGCGMDHPAMKHKKKKARTD